MSMKQAFFAGILLAASSTLAIAKQPARPLPSGATIYIDTNNGFDMFLMAAFQEKNVALKIVTKPEQADYIMDSTIFHSHDLLATNGAAMTGHSAEAAVKLTSKSGDLIWAYAVTKGLLHRGNQSVAEAFAKHLKDLIAKPTTKAPR